MTTEKYSHQNQRDGWVQYQHGKSVGILCLSISQTHQVLTKLIFLSKQCILDIHISVNFIITLSVSLHTLGLSFPSPSTSKQPLYIIDYPQTVPLNTSLLILPIQHSYISISHTTESNSLLPDLALQQRLEIWLSSHG